jgi:hypothetical protein
MLGLLQGRQQSTSIHLNLKIWRRKLQEGRRKEIGIIGRD